MKPDEPTFYSYGQIVFRRKHIVWILENASIFLAGEWPPEPRTGYYNAGGRVALKAEGKHVKPEIIIAEVEERLEQGGADGQMVLAYYIYGLPLKRLAKAVQTSEDEAWRLMNRAIGYAASGNCRRWVLCDNCLNKPRCLKREDHHPMSYNEWVAHKKPKILRI